MDIRSVSRQATFLVSTFLQPVCDSSRYLKVVSTVTQIQFHSKGRPQKFMLATEAASPPPRSYSLIHCGGDHTERSSFELIFRLCGGLVVSQRKSRGFVRKYKLRQTQTQRVKRDVRRVNCLRWFNVSHRELDQLFNRQLIFIFSNIETHCVVSIISLSVSI